MCVCLVTCVRVVMGGGSSLSAHLGTSASHLNSFPTFASFCFPLQCVRLPGWLDWNASLSLSLKCWGECWGTNSLSLCHRTAALTSGALSSPASQQAAVVAMATGLCATASVATSITIAVRWGRLRRRICTRPRLRPSTRASAARRSWCAPWRPWSGAAPPTAVFTCSSYKEHFQSLSSLLECE